MNDNKNDRSFRPGKAAQLARIARGCLGIGFGVFLLGTFLLPWFGIVWLVQTMLALTLAVALFLAGSARNRAMRHLDPSSDDALTVSVLRRLRVTRSQSILFLVFGVGMVFGYVPTRTRGFTEAREVAAAAKLSALALRIGDGFDQFATRHAGTAPLSLEEIASYFPDDERQELLARCRETFIYVSPPTPAEGQSDGIVVSRNNYGGTGRVVGYSKGDARFVHESELPGRLRRSVDAAATSAP